jgi:hypothetical protein
MVLQVCWKIDFFWDVVPCSLVGTEVLEEHYCLKLWSRVFSILRTGAFSSSKIPIHICQAIKCHNTDDSDICSHCYENLKTHHEGLSVFSLLFNIKFSAALLCGNIAGEGMILW